MKLSVFLVSALTPISALFAQTTPNEVIAFERLDVQSILNSNCQPAPVNPNFSTGVVTFTLSSPCTSVSVTGTVTITFPTGTLDGTRTTDSSGKQIFKLATPSTADFTAKVDANINTIAGWTVVANLGIDYIGTPVFDSCRPTGASGSCSAPHLYYALDQASLNPYMLIRLVMQRAAGSEILQYDIKIFFASSRQGVDHLEVVQVVQDARNTVPLIAGKPAFFRAFVRMASEIRDMQATVTARRGDELNGSPKTWKFTAKTDFDRNETGGSENFELPADWTAEGTLSLELELKLPEGTPAPAGFQAKASGTFTFQPGKLNFTVGIVPFCYCQPGKPELRPSLQLMLTLDKLFRKVYPIDPNNIVYQQLPLPMQTWTTPIEGWSDVGVLAYMQKLYDISFHREYDQVVAFFPRIPTSKLAGTSDPKWYSVFSRGHATLVEQVQTGTTPVDAVTVDYNAGTLAHEMGHNLGRRHTNKFGKKPGWCSDYDSRTDFPYADPMIQEPGWDWEKKTVISAAKYGDLMSYCSNEGIPDWISPFNYRKLFEARLLPVKAVPAPDILTAREDLPANAPSGEDIVISGMARRDGGPGRLDPVYRLPSDGSAEPGAETGSHCLHFSGSGGAPLGDYCFDLPFTDREVQEPVEQEFFSMKVSLPAGVTRISLTASGTEKAAITSSSAPPALAITSPKAGDRWDGGVRTISWTGSSRDGKPLVYAVLYSVDGGQRWLAMAMDIKETQFTFDASQINGGRNLMFRVMASDGLDSTTVDVGPLELLQTPVATLSTRAVDFGPVAVDQTLLRTFTISNTGNGPLNIATYTFDQPDLKITGGQAPLMVPAAGSVDITVQWNPKSAGALAGTLKVASNDSSSPAIVNLAGRADVATTCSFTLGAAGAPLPAEGGNSSVDVNASISSCAWTAASADAWIAFIGSARGTGSGTAVFSVSANPTTAPRTGTLTIAGLRYTVSQAAGLEDLGGGNAVLKADGGTFDQAVGYPAGKSNVYFVVRLTPTSYPATLNAVQIYFGRRADGLAQGAALTVLSGASAAASLDGVNLARSAGSVGTLDGFNTYRVAGQTISSGDFVVGFAVDNARGILPADQDATSGSRRRSFVSPNGGASFILLDEVPGVGGNLAIRATVTVGR